MSDTFDHEADAWDQLFRSQLGGEGRDYTSGKQCARCKSYGFYWGEHYNAKGDAHWRLFDSKTKRLHDCGAKPDADAFDVVPE